MRSLHIDAKTISISQSSGIISSQSRESLTIVHKLKTSTFRKRSLTHSMNSSLPSQMRLRRLGSAPLSLRALGERRCNRTRFAHLDPLQRGCFHLDTFMALHLTLLWEVHGLTLQETGISLNPFWADMDY